METPIELYLRKSAEERREDTSGSQKYQIISGIGRTPWGNIFASDFEGMTARDLRSHEPQ